MFNRKRLFRKIFTATLLSLVLICPANAHEINPAVLEKITGEKIESHQHEVQEVEADPRNESRTFYSFPEWYIVYSAQEYGDFVSAGNRPSQFPFFASIGQLWQSWEESERTAGIAPDNTTNTVLWVISMSFSIEYALVGAYEKTLGRIFELLHFGYKTTEDMYVDHQAVAYGEFLNQVPWYEFSYLKSLGGLWKTYGFDSISPRALERRVVFTLGYGAKAIYGGVIKILTQSSFEGSVAQITTIHGDQPIEIISHQASSTSLGNGTYIIDLPRYRAFTEPATQYALAGGNFITIQNNEYISLSVVTSLETTCDAIRENYQYKMQLVTDPEQARFVLAIPVTSLGEIIRSLVACGVAIEHIYDY